MFSLLLVFAFLAVRLLGPDGMHDTGGEKRPARWIRQPDNAGQAAAPAPSGDAAPAGTMSAPSAPFAIDTTRPVRISWPLDIGPDLNGPPDGPATCLRARQGVNELQSPGQGRALYGFRLEQAGRYQSWLRVRWVDDGVGSVQCNNSWFVRIDDGPATPVDNKTDHTTWSWRKGPLADLDAGVHWLTVELREDGTRLHKAVFLRAGPRPNPAKLDSVPVTDIAGFAGMRPAGQEQARIQEAEFFALPTDSLVVGSGHVNEITVGASYQGRHPEGFRGTIEVLCPSAPGLTVRGEPTIACTPTVPFTRKALRIEFPDDAPHRIHRTEIRIRDARGEIVARDEIRFVKAWDWAFLGPFKDPGGNPKQVYRFTGSLSATDQPCDASPARIAARTPPAALGLAALPLASGPAPPTWREVTDGSCYDWTGAVDLSKVYGHVTGAFAYAVSWIRTEGPLHHRSFVFQADDSGWLWMNKRLLVAMPSDLPREAQRLWVSAQLAKGANPVVVKLTQNARYWGFRLDVVDWHWQGRRGDVITGMAADGWPGK